MIAEKSICLRGTRDLDRGWTYRRRGEGTWGRASVPGSNFSDLLREGKIENPFHGDAETRLQWIEEADWEYRCQFEVSDQELGQESVELVFEGLDSLCEVSLNGAPLLDANNMFRSYRCDVKARLRRGVNELVCLFRSPVAAGAKRQAEEGFLYPAENDKTAVKASVYTRKAPYHFGWDWGPKYVTSGVWRPVRLDWAALARIGDVAHRIERLDAGRAEVRFEIELDGLRPGAATLEIVSGADGVGPARREIELSAGAGRYELTVPVENPRLWWPNGLGEAFLYDFEIRLTNDDGLIDRRRQRVGLRTIEVVREPDEIGESFYLRVNGRKVFMKGANYIPPDSFLENMTEARYRRLFADVVGANMNMLRIWGGGVYERELFYDLADENGVLIWQDFMFSCTLYPGDEAFLSNVAEEAVEAVRRLRSHACLALWCGNNEIDLGIVHWEWPEKFGYSEARYAELKANNRTLFESLLGSIVEREDPGRFYLSSSPLGVSPDDPSDDLRGDSHYWGVWHGELPFSAYEERIPRFMSEYGFQSYPAFASIERFIERADRRIGSAALATHQKHPRGDGIISRFIRELYGEPLDFEGFCYLSQLTQADGLRVAFEAHRRNMPRCMGSLYWQLNDCWPAISWSSIDYYGRWKALHYQAARSFAPVMLSFAHDAAADVWRVFAVSDLAQAPAATVTVRLVDLDGREVWTRTFACELAGNASQQVAVIALADVPEGARGLERCVADARLTVGGSELARATHLFCPSTDLELADPELDLVILNESSVAVRARRYARGVQVSAAGDTGGVVNFDDNFFDLFAGETRVLRLREGAFDPASLRVRSLFESRARSPRPAVSPSAPAARQTCGEGADLR